MRSGSSAPRKNARFSTVEKRRYGRAAIFCRCPDAPARTSRHLECRAAVRQARRRVSGWVARVFEIVIALLLVGAGLTALSRRIGDAVPGAGGARRRGLALVPGTPTLVLDPELALTLFVAPVLLDAAFDASPRDLRANWRTVAGLALGAVALTIVVVAVVARWLVPGMPWAVAVALGAIVAPPDAAAATAVLKQLRPPHRLLVILEGESLFNDASALLIYRLAVGAALAGALSPAERGPAAARRHGRAASCSGSCCRA